MLTGSQTVIGIGSNFHYVGKHHANLRETEIFGNDGKSFFALFISKTSYSFPAL